MNIKPHIARALAQRALALPDPARFVLVCRVCCQQWSPCVRSGGRLPLRWWACPKGCNRDGVTTATAA